MQYLSFTRRLCPRRIILRVEDEEKVSEALTLFTVQRVDPPGSLKSYRIAVAGKGPIPVIVGRAVNRFTPSNHDVYTLVTSESGAVQLSTLPSGQHARLFKFAKGRRATT